MTPSSPPPPGAGPRDRELQDAVATLRRHWRRRVLLEGSVKVAAAVLLAVLAGIGLTALLGPGSATAVTVRVVGYLLIVAAAARFLVLPSLRKASDQRIALYVEEQAPELRQTLLSAVHELQVAPAERASPALAARVIDSALGAVHALETGAKVERPRLLRSARALAAMAAGAALLFGFGPAVLRDTLRVLFVPWSEAAAAGPVYAVDVEPGNASVPRGGAVEVRAELRGFVSEGAEVVFRPDSAAEWIRLPMLRDSAAGGFTSRLFDLTRHTEYYVEAEGVRSAAYRLTVTDLPAVSRLSLQLRFPAYTGLPPETIENGGDVAAVIGTTVRVRATVTKPVRVGALRLDNGATIPLTPDAEGRLTGSFKVTADGFYRVDLVAEDGSEVPGAVQYVIEALEDRPPSVRIDEPGRDLKPTAVDEVTVSVRASDDYGVGGLELRYSVNGGAEKRIVLADSGRRGSPELRAAHTLFLEEFSLQPGDLVSYHAVARDAAGHAATSDIYFMEIRAFGRNYRQAEQGGGGGGGGGESPEGFVVRQRQVIAGTFNWLRDSAKTAERRRREDLTTLAIAQGRVKEDVANLVRQMTERNVARADTLFRMIQEDLEAAGREMQAAEEQLGRGNGREALPPEQRALQHVGRAEQRYREVQVQMGGGGGGGGGGGQSERNAEDLADLFELETDKLRNQYEAVQRESEQSAEREVDETMERLRQLASRQQQENERMQRMAEALQDRLGQNSAGGGGGGGGGAQRDLARQAEEEARRLERLARERNSRELADAARRLQEAAESMRRAASGSASQGNAALERLRNATRELENARSSRLSEGVRQLEQRAEQLRERQREVAEDVAGLPGAAGAERTEQLRRLGERKDGLAGEVEGLEADAERLSRESRREQPGASGKLREAAEAIRENRIRDKIVFSKGVIRGGSTEYARSFEQQIGENLEEVAGRLREAAGALTGESAERQRDRSLEQTRELVRGMESIRERIGERTGQRGQAGREGQPAPGQQARPGQEGQEGQGQRGAPGQAGQQGQGQGQGGEGERQGETEGEGRSLSGTPSGSPTRLGAGDARQFTREFQMRRRAAEELRRDLSRQGIDVRELDRAIDDLRRLESGRPLGDPKGLEQLQAAVIEGLKTFEFQLYRRLGLGEGNRPVLGAPAQVPPEYRALVEEYYRSLGRRPQERP